MPAHLPEWVRYLLAFDVKYRERRLHFLIEGQNRLYELLGQERFAGLDPRIVDRLKRDFYDHLERLRRREERRLLQRRGQGAGARRFSRPSRPPARSRTCTPTPQDFVRAQRRASSTG